MVETQDVSSEKQETLAISFAAVAGAAEHPTKATQQRSATTTATEQSVAEDASVASSQGDTGASSQVSDAAVNVTEKKIVAAAAPPKVNPWKKRSEQTSKSPSPAPPTAASAPKQTDTAAETTKPAGKSALVEDQTLWPTLDTALQQVDLAATSRRQSAPESGTTPNGEHATTKPAGKKEWVKYTPIITHTPIASQIKRGSAAGSSGGHARGSSHTGGGRQPGNGNVPRFSRSTSAGNKDSGNEYPADGSGGDGQQGRPNRMTSEQNRAGDRKRAQSATNQRMPRSPDHHGQETAEDQTAERSTNTSRSSSKLRGDGPFAGHEQVVGTAPQTQHAYGAEKPQRGPRDPATFNGSTGRGGRGGAAYAPRGHRGNHNMQTNGHQNASFRHGGRTSFGSPREFVGYMGDGVPMSFVNPAQQTAYLAGPGILGMPPMMMDPMMARPLVQQQLEYYFSIENLCKDLFLRKHMDDQGFVALPILARFNRVRSITVDYGLIRDVCAASSLIELKCVPGGQDKIRKQEGWEQWVLPAEQRDASTHTQQRPQQQEGSVNGAGQLSDLVAAPAFVPGKQVSTSPQVNELAAVGRTEAASEAA